ncbi:MAG: hypothetical protein FWE91_02080 [Defluviitaleaceae bacterium]|nr:hypothetical protein [Defluviitaleaceae bacterium]MCL2836097.1 hypothetical protein [Defluviitaleaceae bacterium]
MASGKKARRAQALKKARRKKIAVISACALVIAAAALIIINSPRPGNDDRTDTAASITDFTAMSSTMAYAAINSIYENPAGHIGRTIRARGTYHPYSDPSMGQYYHYITLTDAPGCCPQILEFKLSGEPSRQDYPPQNALIEITGVFSSYEELGHTYYYWAVEDLITMN